MVLDEVLQRCSYTASWFGVEAIDVNSINDMGDTPLHTVCSWGELNPVKVLIDAGADINAKGDFGCSPLFNAVIGGNIKIIKYLLASGANIGVRNDDDRNVIQYARHIGASSELLDVLNKAF